MRGGVGAKEKMFLVSSIYGDLCDYNASHGKLSGMKKVAYLFILGTLQQSFSLLDQLTFLVLAKICETEGFAQTS